MATINRHANCALEAEVRAMTPPGYTVDCWWDFDAKVHILRFAKGDQTKDVRVTEEKYADNVWRRLVQMEIDALS